MSIDDHTPPGIRSVVPSSITIHAERVYVLMRYRYLTLTKEYANLMSIVKDIDCEVTMRDLYGSQQRYTACGYQIEGMLRMLIMVCYA